MLINTTMLKDMNNTELLLSQKIIEMEREKRKNDIDNNKQSLAQKSKEALVNLIKNNYNDCLYHSVIQLNQQCFNENQAEKMFKYFLTNYYQLNYGKHQSLSDKPQMKYFAILEYGKSGKTTHFHLIHNPIIERFNNEIIIQQANNFLILANNETNNISLLGKETDFSKHLVDEYIRFNTNAMMTMAIKKIMKNANVETKLIDSKYHFENLCEYFTKELNENNFTYYTEDYFLKNDKYSISEQQEQTDEADRHKN